MKEDVDSNAKKVGNLKYIKEVFMNSDVEEGSYLKDLPIVKHLRRQSIPFNKNVTFFMGENGTGKSTLLEAIAVAFGFNPEGGTRNFRFSTKVSHSNLNKHIILAKERYAIDGFFLRAESLYNVATNIEELADDAWPSLFDSYGGVSLHNQSHGESFLSIIQNRFSGGGLYLLDEPEAALSPARLMVLMAELKYLVDKDSQFIIATHSPMLTAYPDSEVYYFTSEGVKLVDYQETEHFKITKSFLNDPDRMLNYLLK